MAGWTIPRRIDTLFAEIRELWDSPDHLQAGPWEATPANDAVNIS